MFKKPKIYGEYTNECSHEQTGTYSTASEAVSEAIALKNHLMTMNVKPAYHIKGLGYVVAGPRQFVGIVYYK